MPTKSRTNLSLRPEPKCKICSFPGRNPLSFISIMAVIIIYEEAKQGSVSHVTYHVAGRHW